MKKFPNDEIVSLAMELGMDIDSQLLTVAVRQYLKNLKRVRSYKKNISKKTRDKWNAKRRRTKKKKQEQIDSKLNQQENTQYQKDLRYIMIRERAER